MQPVGKSITGDTVYNLACPNANQYLEWTAQQGTRRTVNKTIQSQDPETKQQSPRTWFKDPNASTYNAEHESSRPRPGERGAENLKIIAAKAGISVHSICAGRAKLTNQPAIPLYIRPAFPCILSVLVGPSLPTSQPPPYI